MHPRHPVLFIGAGPGHPDLITRRGWAALGQADIVLHDALLDVQGFQVAAPQARWVDVGKRAGQASAAQSFICKSIVSHALRGQRVARLKGGDPAVFGRLTEEIDACRSAGMEVQIIPGVTAASSCAAELGIGLTQRDVARSVTFLTPTSCRPFQRNALHETPHLTQRTPSHQPHPANDEHWLASALHSDTVVFYMAGHMLGAIARTLLAHGKAPDTPLAWVQSASTAPQKSVSTLGECAHHPPLFGTGPVTILLGQVVDSARTSALHHPAIPNNTPLFEPTP